MRAYSMLFHVAISDYMTPFHVSSDRQWLVDMEYCGVENMTLLITSVNLQGSRSRYESRAHLLCDLYVLHTDM